MNLLKSLIIGHGKKRGKDASDDSEVEVNEPEEETQVLPDEQEGDNSEVGSLQ
jgi:hypothetical protein